MCTSSPPLQPAARWRPRCFKTPRCVSFAHLTLPRSLTVCNHNPIPVQSHALTFRSFVSPLITTHQVAATTALPAHFT